MRFKNAYDRAQKSIGVVNDVALEIDRLLGVGGEEEISQALAMEADLDAAQAEADKAIALYQKLSGTDEYASQDLGALFVPASDEIAKQDGQGKVVSRETWSKMDPKEQAAFVEQGGKVEKLEE